MLLLVKAHTDGSPVTTWSHRHFTTVLDETLESLKLNGVEMPLLSSTKWNCHLDWVVAFRANFSSEYKVSWYCTIYTALNTGGPESVQAVLGDGKIPLRISVSGRKPLARKKIQRI